MLAALFGGKLQSVDGRWEVCPWCARILRIKMQTVGPVFGIWLSPLPPGPSAPRIRCFPESHVRAVNRLHRACEAGVEWRMTQLSDALASYGTRDPPDLLTF